jgi:hypothetical protein
VARTASRNQIETDFALTFVAPEGLSGQLPSRYLFQNPLAQFTVVAHNPSRNLKDYA